MRLSKAGIWLWVTLLVAAPASAGKNEKPVRVENATAGISIARPAGWRTATVSQLAENRDKIRLSDAELERALKTQTTPALIAFMKHSEPYDDINPSIQIILRPAPESITSAAKVLEVTVDVLAKAHQDFEVVEPIHKVTVGGLPGAGMKVRYTLRTDAGEFEVLGRTWVAQRGRFLVLVGMAGAQEGENVAEEEFAAAFRSLKIER